MRVKIDLKTISSAILLLVILAIVLVSVFSLDTFNKNNSENTEKQIAQIQDIINKNIVQCYALEGAYPPDLDYLVSNYGLILNKDKFIYYYEAQGSNILPDVRILTKN